MTNPYLFPEGNIHVAFSGGRTSAFMLRQLIEANGIDAFHSERVKVIFTNTGKEAEETLEFVRDCGEHWEVPIIWGEYDLEDGKPHFRLVDFDTASREGEPFTKLIRQEKSTPNNFRRLCTRHLKARTAKRICERRFGWEHWSIAIGFRLDEAHRATRRDLEYKDNTIDLFGLARDKRKKPTSKFVNWYPLIDGEVVKPIIARYWQESNFDLNLEMVNGVTPRSNCDLCFFKSEAVKLRLIRENPSVADWWIEQEEYIDTLGRGKDAGRFNSKYTMRQLVAMAQNQSELGLIGEQIKAHDGCGADEAGECM